MEWSADINMNYVRCDLQIINGSLESAFHNSQVNVEKFYRTFKNYQAAKYENIWSCMTLAKDKSIK